MDGRAGTRGVVEGSIGTSLAISSRGFREGAGERVCPVRESDRGKKSATDHDVVIGCGFNYSVTGVVCNLDGGRSAGREEYRVG